MTALERFETKYRVDDETGCWIWTGADGGHGYGMFWGGRELGRRPLQAHRASYRLHVGEIPEGLQIDHLCRVRACVNPEHLEPVTNRENTLRGTGFAAENAKKTRCANGHEYTPENTRVTLKGYRQCRECARAVDRQRYRASRSVLIRRGDRVVVVDPTDDYNGLAGTVTTEPFDGLISGRSMVTVLLDGRGDDLDVEGFYLTQIVPAFSVAV